MKITKQELINVIEKLEDCVDMMENKNVEEIATKCSTYGIYEFISFGSKGYLDISGEYIEIESEDE